MVGSRLDAVVRDEVSAGDVLTLVTACSIVGNGTACTFMCTPIWASEDCRIVPPATRSGYPAAE